MKVFIIGLDGASPDLISTWMEQGKLPNLSRLYERGVTGPLDSTFPPLTGPAWSSFLTGVNPGKHGVYHWVDSKYSNQGKVVNSTNIHCPTIWDLASQSKLKVGSLSVPMTYPPTPVNGFLIPGFLTPIDARKKSYPPQLFQELKRHIPQFKFSPPAYIRKNSPQSWVGELKKAVSARGQASRYLYSRYFEHEADFLYMVHFFATDLVQHFLWPTEDTDPDWEPIIQVFQRVDKEIGKLVETGPEDALYILLSDHGSGGLDQIFHTNLWLLQNDYLKLKKGLKTRVKRRLAKLGFTQQNMKPIGEFLHPLAKRLSLVDENAVNLSTIGALNRIFLSHRDVDWDRTVAYSRSNIGHIRINRKKTLPHGIVSESEYPRIRSEIIDKLKELRNPKTGNKLTRWVKPKEELYWGEATDFAPDILFNPLEEKTLGYGAAMFLSSDVFTPSFRPGHHRKKGILCASGPQIESGLLSKHSLLDLAPTLLNLFSIPLPTEMDGTVISEIAPKTPVYSELRSPQNNEIDADEKKKVRDRLERLGYL